MSKRNQLVDLKYEEIMVQTANATLFSFSDGAEKWIPSKLGDIDENSKQVTVPQWFVEKEDLDQYAVV